jgi:TetR/AcrR family transcriptional regulator
MFDQVIKSVDQTTGAAPRVRDGLTERRILDAAHEVFVRHGTAGARMQDIAREAGVNQALLHYYFRSKSRLAEAVFRRAAGQLLRAVIEALGSDAPLEEKVARIVALEIDHLGKSPYVPGYLISELTYHPDRVHVLVNALTGLALDDVRPRVLTTIRQQVDAEVAQGRMAPITPDQFIVNLISLCIFPFAARPMLKAMLGLDDRGFERFTARRRDELVDFFLKALRP